MDTNFVEFRVGTAADYAALQEKDDATIYRVQKSGGGEDVYIGSKKLNGSGGSAVVVESGVIKFDYDQI